MALTRRQMIRRAAVAAAGILVRPRTATAAVVAPASGKSKGAKMEPDRETLEGVMKVELVAAPVYFIGLPIIVSVTWNNATTDTTLFRVPDLNLAFYQGGRISVALTPKDGEGVPLDSGFARGEEEEQGLTLEPGTKRRMVCDLTNMGVVFHPGQYDLTLTLLRPGVYRSNTVPINLMPLSSADRKEANRLLHMGGETGLDTGAWRYFLESNSGAVKVAPTFGAASRQQLALHLLLQRAMWTPGGVAHVNPAPLHAIQGPHLEAEVAALKYEIMRARRDPHAPAARSEMLARFPGLRHRAESADAGEGQLAAYRSICGIESDFLGHETPHPYGR